jgi:hypothetical protein
VVAGHVAFAGRNFVDHQHEPYVLQHSSPPRPRRGSPRFVSRPGVPEFASRRFGPNRGPDGNRRPSGERSDQPGPSQPGAVVPNQPVVAPSPRFAVPRSSGGMPASQLSPAGNRSSDAGRPVMTPRGAYTPAPQAAPQTSAGAPFPVATPGSLPQTRYGMPIGLPPLTPPATISGSPMGSIHPTPQPTSGDAVAPGRMAVPRSQPAPAAAAPSSGSIPAASTTSAGSGTSGRTASGTSGGTGSGTSGGTGSGTSRGRSR